MELHYSPGTISIAVAIALEEVGVKYEAVQVDFANAAQTKPAYLAINPKGRVPALVTEGTVLTETGAILEYVAPSLIPSSTLQAAKMREAMYYLASTMHINHAHSLRGARWANNESSFDDMKSKVPETMAASCAYLEETYTFSPFVLGKDLTLADLYLYVVTTWLPGDSVDIANYPKLAAFQTMMRKRASVEAVIAKGMLSGD